MNTPADITPAAWDIYTRIRDGRTDAEIRATILEGMDQGDAVLVAVAAHPAVCAWKPVQVDGVTVGWTFQTDFGKRKVIRYGAILRGADTVLSVNDDVDQAADDVRAGAAAAGTLATVAEAGALEDAAPAAEDQTVAATPAPAADLPSGVTVVTVPTQFRDWYAVDCIRHTGHPVKVAGDFTDRDDAVCAAWDHWEAEHREADDALTLAEIDRAVELAAELGEAQYGVLWTAHTGDVLEDAQGFFTYSHTTDAPVKLSRDRVLRLMFAGYLGAYPEGEHRRTFRLTPKGDRARRLLFRARRRNVVELAAKDGGLGVPAAKLRRYPLLSEGHAVRARLLPAESPAAGGCATTPTPVVFSATENSNRKDNPAMSSTAPKLTTAQTDAVAAMKRNGGWAKKGDGVNRRTFAALVDKGLATWTINVDGGHWAGYLNDSAAAPAAAVSAERLAVAARVREHYPSAGDFAPVTVDGQDVAHTFVTGPLPQGKYGWALPDGTVGPRLRLTRAEAEASARRHAADVAAPAAPAAPENPAEDAPAAAPALADPVTEFAAAAADQDAADTTAPAAATMTPADAAQAVAGQYPNARGFQPEHDADGVFLGYTFQVGQLHGARYGWITGAGTYGRGLEPYRSEAAALLPCQVADDKRVAERREVARAQDALTAAAEARYPQANGYHSVRDAARQIIGWTFRTAYGVGAGPNPLRFAWILNDHTVGATPQPTRADATAEAKEHAAVHPQTPQRPSVTFLVDRNTYAAV